MIKILCIAMTGILWSCSSDLLNLAPIDYFGQGNFWKTETQIKGFMDGLHSQFRGHQFQFLRLGELRDGQFDVIHDGTFAISLSELPLLRQQMDESTAPVGTWGGFYPTILQINAFIEKVEAVDFLPQEKKNQFLGQAYGLRAFYYFHMLRTFGGVPLRTKPDVLSNPNDVALRLARSTEAEILAFVKEEVDRSVTLFATASAVPNKALWNKNASFMLQGEVYLWSAKVYGTTADLATAKTALESVTGISLITEKGDAKSAFANVFYFDNKKNDEIILAIHSALNEGGLSVGSFIYDGIGSFNGLYYKPDFSGATFTDATALDLGSSTGGPRYVYDIDKVYKLYGENADFTSTDQRRDATLMAFYRKGAIVADNVGTTILKKFLGTKDASGKRQYVDDWPVYREADRLLLLAEIANANGDFATMNANLKKVRERAGLTHANVAVGDAGEIAIFEERLKEFVWEGKGWYDLRRMKVGEKPMAIKQSAHSYGVIEENESHKLLWPIERGLWTTDPLVNQTPGYATSKP